MNVFSQPGRFWRGNLHTHSTASDGSLDVIKVCELYRASGYHFLAITDHFVQEYDYPITDARASETEDFVTLRSAELHAGRIESADWWHLLGIGLTSDFGRPSVDETGQQLAARALAAGSFVVAAHPAWYGASVDEIRSLGPIHAIETWNATVADLNDRADSWYVLDQLLSRGGRYNAIAADDAHFSGRNDAFQAWVWVKAEQLTRDAILEGLIAGRYYSSTGPTIRSVVVDLGRKSIAINCSPVDDVFVTGRGYSGEFIHGESITEAVVDISAIEGSYCRVTVRDSDGRRAWSNPIWLDD